MQQGYELLSTEEDGHLIEIHASTSNRIEEAATNQIELIDEKSASTTLQQRLERMEQEITALKLENKELKEEMKKFREEKEDLHFKHFCMENTISKTVMLLAKELEDNGTMYKVYKNSREKMCNSCKKKSTNLKICSVCYRVYYCDVKCQQNDYASHSEICKKFAAIQKK